MEEIATAREHAAATYRRMAHRAGSHAARYLQRAAQLDRSAARARRFVEQELEQLAKWQPPDDAHDTAS